MSNTASGLPQRAPASLLFVLVCAMGVGPLLNYGLSAASPLVLHDLGITQSQFGLLAGAVFALVVAALAQNFWVLLAAVILAGPAQSISNPTTNRLIVTSVPHSQRSGWIGIKQSGVQASQLFAGLFIPAVSLWLGWHGAFGLAAVVAIGLLWYSLRKLPADASSRRATTARAEGTKEPLPLPVWLFAAFAFFSGLGMQATNVYLPLYAVRALDFPLVLAGAAAGVSGVVGVTSRVIWGRQMNLGRRPSGILIALAAGAVVGVLCLLGAAALHQPALLWAGVALHGATVLGANVITNSAVLVVVPAHRVGTASGILAMGMYAGFALGPFVMGLLADASGGYGIGWLTVGAGYLVCVGVALWLRRYGATHPWTGLTAPDPARR